ncbi:MAG TPA: DNA-processing protein DprA [Erysipelothrix sp.]|nr:DNA-processing protein DprA [Erysipelothrix sp.]
MRERLKDLVVYCEGDYERVSKMLKQNIRVSPQKVDVPYVCIGDKDYPKALYDLKKPPFVLFYRGNLSLLKKPCVSVVGSRYPSLYAKEMTQELVNKLKRDYVIVSGLARRIDTISHQNALDFFTVAVLGCGIDVVYPKENASLFKVMERTQCIISEYPPQTKPQKHYFPFRNRIIAALSPKLYVMSAGLRSGTMTTVNEALILNRHVICLPHPIDMRSGQGCNQLILEGADILTSVDGL